MLHLVFISVLVSDVDKGATKNVRYWSLRWSRCLRNWNQSVKER